jgi:hypothetical protein
MIRDDDPWLTVLVEGFWFIAAAAIFIAICAVAK